jgi:hypothetical protein
MNQHSVFACNLGALSVEERQRLTTEIGPKLRGADRKVRELKDGYEIRFLDGRQILPTVAEWLSMEGRCCSFFNLSMKLRGNGGPLTVRITGEDGTKEFIRDELPGLAELTAATSETEF